MCKIQLNISQNIDLCRLCSKSLVEVFNSVPNFGAHCDHDNKHGVSSLFDKNILHLTKGASFLFKINVHNPICSNVFFYSDMKNISLEKLQNAAFL